MNFTFTFTASFAYLMGWLDFVLMFINAKNAHINYSEGRRNLGHLCTFVAAVCWALGIWQWWRI
jgi:hypothetical protein